MINGTYILEPKLQIGLGEQMLQTKLNRLDCLPMDPFQRRSSVHGMIRFSPPNIKHNCAPMQSNPRLHNNQQLQ